MKSGNSERDPSSTPAGVEPGGLARQVAALGEVDAFGAASAYSTDELPLAVHAGPR
jgi:hypothetical protein